MGRSTPKISEIRAAATAARNAPMLGKIAHAERVAELTLELLEDLERRITALEHDNCRACEGI